MPWLLVLLSTSLGLALGSPRIIGVAAELLDGDAREGLPFNITYEVVTPPPDHLPGHPGLSLDQQRMVVTENKMIALEEENKYLRTKTLKTCEDLKTSPYNETGFYTLDPDSSGEPVDFFCDMDKGFTEVGHDHESVENVTWCQGSGCYSLTLTYSVPLAQIEALIAMSGYCEQQIQFECKFAPLKKPAYGVKYGWWTDQRDEKKYYFDGANETSEICDINTNNGVCNCDMSLVPLWNSDSGKITNKSSLPIKGFHYGGFFSEHQAARITIGKLRCSGKSQTSETLLSSCSSLKKNGLSSNGFYLTKESPASPVSVAYCQLSAPGYKEEQLRRGDTAALGGEEEFTIANLTCSSCSPCPKGHNLYVGISNDCNTYYDIDSLTLSPNTSAHFSFEGRHLVAKTSGFYGISKSAQIEVLNQGNTIILHRSTNYNFVRIEKGDKLSIKTTYDSMDSIRGSKLIIALLN